MLVIGEKINATNRSVGEAIIGRNREFIEDLARKQAEAGADFIDVNAGIGKGSGQNEAEAIEWLVEVVQAVTDKPLVIDSDTPDVIEAGLRNYNGDGLIVNSVTAEPEKLESIGALAAGRKASLVALAMGAEGIPATAEKRLEACDKIMTHLPKLGITEEQVFFDPLVLPISVDSRQGMVTLETIKQIKARYPAAKTVMGLSNISFGLPMRKLINRSFLLMAASVGLDAAILDPLDTKVMGLIKVADMLVGRDTSCRNFTRSFRKGIIID